MKVIWAPLAEERAKEIARFIGQESREAARLWLIDVFGAVERLEQFPHSGRKVPEIQRADIREIIQGKYRIIYRLESDRISILTVQHGRQSLAIEELPKPVRKNPS